MSVSNPHIAFPRPTLVILIRGSHSWTRLDGIDPAIFFVLMNPVVRGARGESHCRWSLRKILSSNDFYRE